MRYLNKLFTFVFEFFKKNPWLFVLLLFGLFLRAWGIYFDSFRVAYIWDETYDLSYLLNVLEKRTLFLNPSPSTYPLVLPIIYLPFTLVRLIYLVLVHNIQSVVELKDFLIMNGFGNIYIVGRWVAVLFGTFSIFIVYRISEILFKNKLTWYFVGIFYAVSVLPIFISHWGKHHTTMAFFLLLSLYFSLKYEDSKLEKYFTYCVISAALSICTHYVGVSAVIFPLVALIQNRKEFNLKKLFKHSSLFLAIIAILYLGNYYGVKRMFSAMNSGYYAQNGYSSLLPVGTYERFYYVFRDIFNLDPLIILIIITALIFGLKSGLKNRKFRYVIIALGFNYLIMTTLIVGPKMTRWLLIFYSIGIFFVGYLIELLMVKGLKKKIIIAGFIPLALFNLIVSLKWISLLSANTRLEAEQWMKNNVKNNELIYSFDDLMELPLSYQAALWNKENNPGMDTAKKNMYIIDNKEKYSDYGYHLLFDRGVGRFTYLGGPNTDFFLISFVNQTEKDLILNKVQKGFEVSHLKSFYPTVNNLVSSGKVHEILNNPIDFHSLFKLNKSGPFVEIYKIIN